MLHGISFNAQKSFFVKLLLSHMARTTRVIIIVTRDNQRFKFVNNILNRCTLTNVGARLFTSYVVYIIIFINENSCRISIVLRRAPPYSNVLVDMSNMRTPVCTVYSLHKQGNYFGSSQLLFARMNWRAGAVEILKQCDHNLQVLYKRPQEL